uniref:AFG1/ZapE family ATPase n=1 Tax=Nocardia farcinica TaxID=37329 RepID=UPI00313C4100
EQLLPNPLFHDRFLPVIAAIRAHLDVVAVDGPQDYRRHGTGRPPAPAARPALPCGQPCSPVSRPTITAPVPQPEPSVR